MKLTKEFIFIILLIGVSLFLRTYNLSSVMQFIPDQGWFYLSARDMLLTGHIPLVGPPTSHPWIHHGPLWTYMLGILLFMFNFDPVMPAYFIAVLGTITVVLFYFVVKIMFGFRLAIFSTILYAASPLIVLNSRIPYHTSPIPFFVILLFFFVFLWTKGKMWTFPVITFILGVLYNHEITTFVYFICVVLVFLYGIVNKKQWSKKLLHVKVASISLLTFLIPMIPFVLHDVQNGYGQTVKFLIWVGYRIVKAPLALIHPSFVSSGSNPSTFGEFFVYYTQLIFAFNSHIALLVLISSCIYLLSKTKKYIHVSRCSNVFKIGVHFEAIKSEYALLVLFVLVGFVGLLTHRVPIEADTLLIAPFIIIITAITIFWILNSKFKLALCLIILIAAANAYYLFHTNYLTQNTKHNRITYEARMQAVGKVIHIANGNSYTIVGRGELSDFPVFLMPYEYLLWWMKSPVEKTNSEKTIEIWEQGDTIKVIEIK